MEEEEENPGADAVSSSIVWLYMKFTFSLLRDSYIVF